MASSTPYALMEATAKKMIEKKYKMLREKFIADLNYADTATNVVINKLIDEVILDTVAEYHRALKTGLCDYLFCTDRDVENSLNNSDGHAFEEEVEKKTEDIKCPNCTRPINASRFAPHLEKCMKMGRNSSRIASRRIANNSKENSYSGIVSDDDDDEDWSAISEKIKISKKIQDPKKKKDKPRKQKLTRNPKEEHTDSKEALPYSKFIIMSSEDKVTFLSSSCGVKMETSGKMCSRSVRCTHHTDEERSALRKLYSLEGVHHDNFVDVEEVEGSKMEAENSCTSSPADSTSTSSSSSTKKKDKKQKPIKSKYSTEQYIPE